MATKLNSWALLASIFMCLPFQSLADDTPSRKPNILIFIADDLGYGETEVMGNEQVPTPGIARLASSGITCTAGYVTSSYCSPSRAGLMTGRYQSRFGYDFNPTGPRNFHPNAGLPRTVPTFLETLKAEGYQTALIGKWHLGARPDLSPTRRGFDRFFGFLHEGHYYRPGPPYEDLLTMLRDKSLPEGARVRQGNTIRGNYAPINEPAYDKDNPLLDQEDVIEETTYLTDAFARESISFIESNKQRPFALVVSFNAVHSPMQAKLDSLKQFSEIEDVQRRIFAAMLSSLDSAVVEIMNSLDRQQLTNSTFVAFLSDNGGPTKELTSSNLPLRGGKGTLYEGGIRVPMIISYPGFLPKQVNEDRPVLSLDIAATAVKLATGKEPNLPMDGKNLLSWVGQSNKPCPHEKLFWRMQRGKYALRSGDYKIVNAGKNAKTELFNLNNDIQESTNLASKQPEVLARLEAEWDEINSGMSSPLSLAP